MPEEQAREMVDEIMKELEQPEPQEPEAGGEGSTQKPEETPTPQEGAEETSGEGEPTVKFPLTLKVNGEERVIKSEEELKALLQKEFAGEKRLQEAAEWEKKLKEKELELKQRELELKEQLLKEKENIEARAEEAGIELTDEELEAIYSGDEEIFKKVVSKIAKASNEDLRKEIEEMKQMMQEVEQKKLQTQIVETITDLKQNEPRFKILAEIDTEMPERYIAASLYLASLEGKITPGEKVPLDKMRELAIQYSQFLDEYAGRKLDDLVVEKASDVIKILEEKKPEALEELKKKAVQEYLARMEKEGETASVVSQGSGGALGNAAEEDEWAKAATDGSALKALFRKLVKTGGE